MKDGKLERLVISIIAIVFTLVMILVISISAYRQRISAKTKNNNIVEQQSVIIPVNKNEPVAQDFTTYPVSDSELNQMAVQFNNQNTGTTNSTVVDQSTTNQDVVLQGLNGDLNKPVSDQGASDATNQGANPDNTNGAANNPPPASQSANNIKEGINNIVSNITQFIKSF